jgi:hypothetical protein
MGSIGMVHSYICIYVIRVCWGECTHACVRVDLYVAHVCVCMDVHMGHIVGALRACVGAGVCVLVCE